MKLITITIAAALFAGCAVPAGEDSVIVATKLIQATASTGTTGGAACTYDVATDENSFGAFNPAVGYQHALVVENRLTDNSGTGPGRVNTNDFQVEGATIKTDVLVGPPQSIPALTVPANGLIPVGGIQAVAIQLAQPGAIQPGSEVRFHIQVFGRLLDGSTVKTNTFQYAASADPQAIRAGSACTAGQTATFCEGSATAQSQDTGAACQ